MFNLPHLNSSILRDRRKELRRNCTEAEHILWRHLKNRRLGFKFSQQFGIENYIVDFCCRELKLIIEIDSPIHEKEDVAEYNQRRGDVLKSFGYKILRFTNNEVLNNVNPVLKTINNDIFSPPSRGVSSEALAKVGEGGGRGMSPPAQRRAGWRGKGERDLKTMNKVFCSFHGRNFDGA